MKAPFLDAFLGVLLESFVVLALEPYLKFQLSVAQLFLFRAALAIHLNSPAQNRLRPLLDLLQYLTQPSIQIPKAAPLRLRPNHQCSRYLKWVLIRLIFLLCLLRPDLLLLGLKAQVYADRFHLLHLDLYLNQGLTHPAQGCLGLC